MASDVWLYLFLNCKMILCFGVFRLTAQVAEKVFPRSLCIFHVVYGGVCKNTGNSLALQPLLKEPHVGGPLHLQLSST